MDMDHSTPPSAWTSIEAIDASANAALEHRLQTGEILTYVVDGWVVREHPAGRIERLAPLADFRDEDFPTTR